jgi:hypothetical protein
MHTLARSAFIGTLAYFAFGVIGGSLPGGPPAAADGPPVGRTVYLTRGLAEDAFLALAATVAARQPDAVVLLDSAKAAPYLKAFLAAYNPDRVVPVGCFPDGLLEVERRLGRKLAPAVPWTRGPPEALWGSLFPRAEQVVVCPAGPRAALLQAACLAGEIQAPLFVLHGRDDEAARLGEWFGKWGTREAYFVGPAHRLAAQFPDVLPVHLQDASAVAALHRRQLARRGAVETVVVANPSDTAEGLGGMSALAPWVALRKGAALLLTNEAGQNVKEVVTAGTRRDPLRHVETVLFVADLKAIPMLRRPNPIPGDKDEFIEMEPLTPEGTEPYTFATGRLFHDDPAVVPLLLARERLLAAARGPRRALVASNAGSGLNLLEAFSRNTAMELRNRGYETTALFGNAVTPDDLRKRLPEQDLFLWEGHHNTLIRDWNFPEWDEPLPPSLVFLQSCLALRDWKVQPLLSRGAVAVVGAGCRTYSASGGACSLAFFDALLYEDQSLGGSLRQAKNFLLAYSLLKEKRLGAGAVKTGANQRAAWAFTLWGDPTLKLPQPETPDGSLRPVRHEVTGNTIVLELPGEAYGKVKTTGYQVSMQPNARLAGLVRKEKDEGDKPLVPFVFAEVHLPRAKPGQTPHLRSKLPPSHYVFCWDARRRCGYLLAEPRSRDEKELRFHVEWHKGDAVAGEVPTAAAGAR